MRKAEQRLWDTFRRNGTDGLWMQRVENVVRAGMPDVFIGGSGAWVELKAPIAPKRKNTRLLGEAGLNIDQINWHLKACTKGIRSYVLIRDSEKRLFLIPGKYAAVMNEMSVGELVEINLCNNWVDIIKEIS